MEGCGQVFRGKTQCSRVRVPACHLLRCVLVVAVLDTTRPLLSERIHSISQNTLGFAHSCGLGTGALPAGDVIRLDSACTLFGTRPQRRFCNPRARMFVAAGKATRELATDDAYAILGLTSTASLEDVKRAWRRAASRLHPDADPSDGARERFDTVRSAYETLLVHFESPKLRPFPKTTMPRRAAVEVTPQEEREAYDFFSAERPPPSPPKRQVFDPLSALFVPLLVVDITLLLIKSTAEWLADVIKNGRYAELALPLLGTIGGAALLFEMLGLGT